MENRWQWWIGSSDERYDARFETREEAIDEGKSLYGGDGFYICEATQGSLNLRVADYDRLLDWLQDGNEERVDPDDGELFRKPPTPEQLNDLETMVNDAIEAWAAKHEINTRSFTFEDSRNEEYIAPEEDAS